MKIVLDEHILLTVVIPFRNSEKTLPATIGSLATALVPIAGRGVELLFVDNGSSDGSRGIVESFRAVQPRVRCIEEHAPGVSSARNAGLAAARGTYIASVDSDDEIAPDYLSALIGALQHQPDLVVLPLPSDVRKIGHQPLSDRRAALEQISGWWGVQFVFRRALCVGLAFQGHCYEDFGFFPRLLQRCTTITLLYGDLYRYMDNPNSLTRQSALWRLSQIEQVARDLLSDTTLLDQDILHRVRKDDLRGRMQLRAIAGLWPVLSLRDCAALILLSRGNRIGQLWHLLRFSASVLRRKIVTNSHA